MSPDPDRLQLVLDRHGDVARIAATGEIDIETAPRLQAAFASALDGPAAHVHVDLTGVEFMDSTGLRVVLCGARTAEEQSVAMSIARPRASVFRIFELAGVAGRLPFVDPAG